MVHIRKLAFEEVDDMSALAAYAFNSEISGERKKRFDYIIQHSQAYGAFDGEQLTSQLLSTPFQVDFHGARYKMAGIGCVSSYPEYRGQGSITALMQQLLSDLAKEKTALSYLAPFSYPFYRRYGFEQLFEQIAYRIDSNDWPKLPKPKSQGRVYRTNLKAAKQVIKRLYAEQPTKGPGGLIREDWWLEYKFGYGNEYLFAVAENQQGDPRGYLVYQSSVERLTIKEWVALDKEAYTDLAGFIGSHSGATKEFYFVKGFTGESLSYLMPAPKAEMKLLPYMMGRIVEIETFVGSYPFLSNGKEGVFHLGINDTYAPWNEGVWKLTIQGGKGRMERLGDIADSQLHDVMQADIQTWTQLFMGYRRAPELLFYGPLSGSSEQAAELDQLIPMGKPQLEDYF